MSLERSSLSPTGVLLRLGPGGTWGEVLELAPPSRYSYPHGQCRSVGVGGYLLGGGVNWLGTYNKVTCCPAHSCKQLPRPQLLSATPPPAVNNCASVTTVAIVAAGVRGGAHPAAERGAG